MKTSTFVILSVIILLIVILYHFQIIRYLTLHCCKPEKYIEKYKNLKTTPKVKTTVTFPVSTSSKNMKPMINSILDQTVRVDSIICVIPDTTQEKSLPPYLSKICFITKSKGNYKSTEEQCLIPALLREDTSDTIIFILDPAYVYGKDFLETIIEEMISKDKPIKSKGALIIRPKHFKEGISQREVSTDLYSFMNDSPNTYSYFETYKQL